MKPGEIARSVSRGALYLGIEKAVALAAGVLYFAMLLRWLGPAGYGTITLALSFAGLATIATGNFEVFLERFAAEYQAQGQLRTLQRAHRLALVFKLGLGILAGAALFLLAGFLAVHFATPELGILIPLVTAIVVFDGLYSTGRSLLYGLQQFRWVCVLAVLSHIAKTVMVGALWLGGRGLPELAAGIAALTVLQGLASVAVPAWMLRGQRDAHPSDVPDTRSLLRAMIGYCAPLYGARTAFLSGQNLGKIVLGKLFDTATLGYYSFAFQTVERFVELVAALPSALLPSLTQLVARKERERLGYVFDQAFRLIQVIACALSFGLVVFAPEMTRVVGSRLFLPAVPLLRILGIVPIARISQLPLAMLFQALRRPGMVLGLALLKFVVEFGCYFTLVPAFGLMGAGWASLAGAGVAYAAALLALARAMPETAGERLATVSRSLLLLLPLLLGSVVIDRLLPGGWSLVARLALVPLAIVGVFAFRLVNGYDFEKISSIPLGVTWVRRARDSAVAAGDRLARALAPRRA